MNPMLIGGAAGGGLGFLNALTTGREQEQRDRALRIAEHLASPYRKVAASHQVREANPLGELLAGVQSGAQQGPAYGQYQSNLGMQKALTDYFNRGGPNDNALAPDPAQAYNEAPLAPEPDPEQNSYERVAGVRDPSKAKPKFDPNNPYSNLGRGRVAY